MPILSVETIKITNKRETQKKPKKNKKQTNKKTEKNKRNKSYSERVRAK